MHERFRHPSNYQLLLRSCDVGYNKKLRLHDKRWGLTKMRFFVSDACHVHIVQGVKTGARLSSFTPIALRRMKRCFSPVAEIGTESIQLAAWFSCEASLSGAQFVGS